MTMGWLVFLAMTDRSRFRRSRSLGVANPPVGQGGAVEIPPSKIYFIGDTEAGARSHCTPRRQHPPTSDSGAGRLQRRRDELLRSRRRDKSRASQHPGDAMRIHAPPGPGRKRKTSRLRKDRKGRRPIRGVSAAAMPKSRNRQTPDPKRDHSDRRCSCSQSRAVGFFLFLCDSGEVVVDRRPQAILNLGERPALHGNVEIDADRLPVALSPARKADQLTSP